MQVKQYFRCLFTSPFIFIALIGVSITSLASALIAQYVFGLHPCELCLYQRVPFVVAIILGLIGLYMDKKAYNKTRNIMIAFLGLNFIANTIIAAFHTGVERKWWRGLEGCSAPDMSGSMEEILARINAAPIARCDEIPWADPILGLSMANYNFAMCLVVTLYCAIVLFKYACRK